jgi:hypothetical protein
MAGLHTAEQFVPNFMEPMELKFWQGRGGKTGDRLGFYLSASPVFP